MVDLNGHEAGNGGNSQGRPTAHRDLLYSERDAIFRQLSIGLLKCSAMEPSLLCPDCQRLEREYQLTIAEIYSVVGGRFKTLREKLRELFRWQDVRDKAVEAFYEHKKTHAGRASGLHKGSVDPSHSAPNGAD